MISPVPGEKPCWWSDSEKDHEWPLHPPFSRMPQPGERQRGVYHMKVMERTGHNEAEFQYFYSQLFRNS